MELKRFASYELIMHDQMSSWLSSNNLFEKRSEFFLGLENASNRRIGYIFPQTCFKPKGYKKRV